MHCIAIETKRPIQTVKCREPFKSKKMSQYSADCNWKRWASRKIDQLFLEIRPFSIRVGTLVAPVGFGLAAGSRQKQHNCRLQSPLLRLEWTLQQLQICFTCNGGVDAAPFWMGR